MERILPPPRQITNWTDHELGFGILDQLSYGFIVVDENANVLLSNAAARSSASPSDGLYIVGNTLRASIESENDELKATIACMARHRATVPAVHKALAISAGSVRMPVLVIPARLDEDPLLGPQCHAIVIFARESGRPHRDLLIAMYRLTPREADLVSELMAGKTLLDGARDLAMTTHTARTHLRHAMEKTGTSRQADLVRVLFHSNLPD